MKRKVGRRNVRKWAVLVLAVVILVPSLLGFGSKFVEFFATYRSDAEGAFAITPILNYLLASAGFFLLLLWAAANGMFGNIEQPKFDMLAREAMLDGQERPNDEDSGGGAKEPTAPEFEPDLAGAVGQP